MRKLLRLAARVYPAAWRERYGAEFRALLDETKPGWRDIVDVLTGGLRMHLRRAHTALRVAAFGIVGALGAGAIAFTIADRFASTATIDVRPAAASTASDTAWLKDTTATLARDAFSPDALTGIIQKHDLYHAERTPSSTDALVNRMRGDIGVELVSRSVIQVTFASADADKVQKVAYDLVSQLVSTNVGAGHRSVVRVLDPPDAPQASVSPRRVATAGLGGLSGGALIGMLSALLRRRSSQRSS